MEAFTARVQEIFALAVTSLPGALAIVVGAIVLKFLLNRGLDILATRTRLTRSDVAPLRKVGGWVIFAVTVVLLLGIFGVNLGGLWAMLTTVLAMVAIGFVAVWSVLSNISCTVMILIFRPFSIGDIIEFAGDPVRGRVVDLTFLYTTLKTDEGDLIQVPNNLFFQKVVKRTVAAGAERVSLAEQLQSEKPAEG